MNNLTPKEKESMPPLVNEPNQAEIDAEQARRLRETVKEQEKK